MVNRFRGGEQLRPQLEEALAVLREQPGYVDGVVGHNVDDPDLWLLQTRWDGPGAYRRALSTYDVKVGAWALLGQAIEEPNAYTVIRPGDELNRAEPRAIR